MTDASDVSPILSLPFYQAKQNEFEVQHNEALMMLDALAMLSVIDRDLMEPPASPAQGDRYLVKAGATGGFAGQDNRVAQYDVGGWNFYTPKTGWTCYVQDERTLLAWDGSAWQAALDVLSGGASELQNMTLLGIGTEADAINPLSAKLNNALWTARTEAEGGDGTLRYKLSKESEDKTLSLLFQDNYSGRAEIGLTGDDDFHFKVSDDGETWRDGIVIAAATGRVSFPQGLAGSRQSLTAPRTYYVRADGDDGNDGLSDDSAGAFLTPQRAYDVITSSLDLAGFTVTIQIGDGTYAPVGGASALAVSQPWTGGGMVVVQGNSATPADVVLSTTSANAIWIKAALPGVLRFKDFKLQTATSGDAIRHDAPGIVEFGNLNFGACAGCHIKSAASGATVKCIGSYAISAGAAAHSATTLASAQIVSGVTVTLSGTPAFSALFAQASTGGQTDWSAVTFSGSATGTRYSALLNGVLYTGGGGANYFPGNATGSTGSGGQYL
jgi:hypothetical protein